jgi:transcriptional regulator with XRE-family HTH domain
MLNQGTKRGLLRRLKRVEWIYAVYYKLTLLQELRKAKREMLRYEVKSKQQIEIELNLIRNYWNCTYTDFYLFYGLYKKHLHTEELLDYVPPFYFLNFHQEVKHKEIDTIRYKNKLTQYHLFKELGITTSELVAKFENGLLVNPEGESISISNLVELYLKDIDSKLFFKPAMGQGGAGIKVLKRVGANLSFGDDLLDHDQVITALNSSITYVIEDGIKQREDLNAINSSCVNTLRVIAQNIESEMYLSVCILRMGRSNSDVDNSAQGGLSIQVDIQTGQFSEYAIAEHGGGMFYHHPDSGFEFKNEKIEDWNSIRLAILRNAQHLAMFRDIALDVAITKTGIEIIEFNFGYGIDHLQSTCGGMRRKLHLNVPNDLPDSTNNNMQLR